MVFPPCGGSFSKCPAQLMEEPAAEGREAEPLNALGTSAAVSRRQPTLRVGIKLSSLTS